LEDIEKHNTNEHLLHKYTTNNLKKYSLEIKILSSTTAASSEQVSSVKKNLNAECGTKCVQVQHENIQLEK
jgi:hypothetical protein